MNTLSPNEREVLKFASRGHSTRTTALAMGLKVETVRAIRANVLRKSSARTMAHAVAIRLGGNT